jgi:hypothetical protein
MLKELDRVLTMAAMLSDDEDEDVDDIVLMRSIIASKRFINLRQHVHKNKTMQEALWKFGEREFRMHARMNQASFLTLLTKICEHPVFGKQDQRHKQAPVWSQLFVVLQRLGCDGNGASVGRCGTIFGFSAGSVCKFTERVYKAIMSLHDEAIYWPNAEERKEIAARFGAKYGLPGCVDIADGTGITLAQSPSWKGNA